MECGREDENALLCTKPEEAEEDDDEEVGTNRGEDETAGDDNLQDCLSRPGLPTPCRSFVAEDLLSILIFFVEISDTENFLS